MSREFYSDPNTKNPAYGDGRVFQSVKNEGYNHGPLSRSVLRRVEQSYSTVAVPSFEYGYIKHHFYENCVKFF